MNLYELIANLKFIGIKNYRDMDIDALTCSSKEKCNNSIYFCIKGLNADGHDFAIDAIKNGAVCLVVEKYLDLPITQIMVDNVRATMSYIASVFYATNKSKIKFIGITGTNGKTTTTFLIREILTKLNKKVGLIGTEGIFINSLMLPAQLTTPDPINLHKIISDMERNGCEFCVMEVSAHAIALNKIDDIMFEVVGLSNITKDHLDFFVNMENYVKCKSSLFNLKHAKNGVVNLDAKFSKEIVKKSNLNILSYGKDAELKILEINTSIKGTTIKFEYNNKNYSVSTNLIGEYNAYNLLMAISCLIQLEFNIKEILSIIKTSKFEIPGRFNFLTVDANFNVVIDYAHTPDGMKNIIKAVEQIDCNRIITVFGCGGNRDKTKRNEMGKTAVQLSDYVIVTTDNPRDENPNMIIDDIVQGIESKKMIRIAERKSAIEYALSIAKENDVVLILGKGAENYQEIKGVKHYFSDYEAVDNYFKYSIKDKIKI